MIKTVPWKNDEYNGAIQSIAGQNISKLKDYVDIISPMTYSHMIKRKPQYIHDITIEVNELSDKKVIPCVQIEKTYLDKNIHIQEFEEMLNYGLKKPSNGIILFQYQYLEKDEKKSNLVKNLVWD